MQETKYVLVSNDNENWEERILVFVSQNSKCCFIVVATGSEESYLKQTGKFAVECFKYIK